MKEVKRKWGGRTQVKFAGVLFMPVIKEILDKRENQRHRKYMDIHVSYSLGNTYPVTFHTFDEDGFQDNYIGYARDPHFLGDMGKYDLQDGASFQTRLNLKKIDHKYVQDGIAVVDLYLNDRTIDRFNNNASINQFLYKEDKFVHNITLGMGTMNDFFVHKNSTGKEKESMARTIHHNKNSDNDADTNHFNYLNKKYINNKINGGILAKRDLDDLVEIADKLNLRIG